MSQTDLMHRIVALQLFDGSFNLDTNLCGALNVNHAAVTRLVAQNGWNPKPFAVTLVLAFFRDKLSSLENDWELVADKSRLYLLENSASTADAMFESAVKFVGM